MKRSVGGWLVVLSCLFLLPAFPVSAQVCGDFFCDPGEEFTCPQDCSSCGNMICDPGEEMTCPQDCAICGDQMCTLWEEATCPEDCPMYWCGNGWCDPWEDWMSCYPDCHCGNLMCDPGEDPISCPLDCPCGNGLCDIGEDLMTCPIDCAVCGDGLCTDPPENVATCWDCNVCGDGFCMPPEDPASCYDDCGSCGDGLCTAPNEDPLTCPDDCGPPPPWCGDYICNGGETEPTCYQDCGSCGTGICAGPEDGFNCPGDCGGPGCKPADFNLGACPALDSQTTVGRSNTLNAYACGGGNESGPEYVYGFYNMWFGQITATLTNTTANLDVFILSGGGPDACTADCLAYGDTIATYPSSTPGDYYIVVEGLDGAAGDFTLEVGCSFCGDMVCDGGENPITCPGDCGFCGDFICNPMFEDPMTCPADCAMCGNGICDPGEDTANCTVDCFAGLIWYVDAAQALSGDGASWATAFKTIQEAVGPAGAAGAGDMVWVKAGTYTNNGGGTASVLQMQTGIEIYGGFAGGELALDQRLAGSNFTILDGRNTSTHVVTGADSARLDRFVVTGGNAVYESGAGMYNVNVSPTVAHCWFIANVADTFGGAMYNQNNAPVITDCEFMGNDAPDTFSSGGAIYYENAGGVISDSIFSANSTGYGGALYFGDGSLELINCIFRQNQSNGGNGGAILTTGYGNIQIINCSFFENHTTGMGGGIFFTSFSNATTRNCIFWANSADDSGDQITNWSLGAVTIDHSDVQGGWGGDGNLDRDPLFVNAPGGDLHLQPGSSCIDAGTTSGAPATDIDGSPRPFGPGVDMGAYEFVTVNCGDGLCAAPYEDADSCPADCYCGDAVCDPTEDAASCYADCGSCGDGRCTAPFEDLANCYADCGACGDGLCSNPPEDAASCYPDCGSCGDGICTVPEEDSITCPADCVCVDLDGDIHGDGCAAGPDCDDANENAWDTCATCIDADGDSYFQLCNTYVGINGPDCDDASAATYPGAPEICDGLDNQCPGDPGSGQVDETCAVSVALVDPIADTDVLQNEFFDFTVNVTCTGSADCGEVKVYLDPTTDMCLESADVPCTGGCYSNPSGYGSILGKGNDCDGPNDGYVCPGASYDFNYTLADAGAQAINAVTFRVYGVPCTGSAAAYPDRKLQFYLNGNYLGESAEVIDYGCFGDPPTWPLWVYTNSDAAALSGLYNYGGNNLFTARQQYGIASLCFDYMTVDLDYSEVAVKGLVSTTVGATPFYTTNPNPTTVSLTAGQSQQITWSVNPTGAIDSAHTFFATATLAGNTAVTLDSDTVKITIRENCGDADGDGRGVGCVAGPDCDDANPNAWDTCATCVDADADGWYKLCNRYQTVNGPDCDDAAATGNSCHNTCASFYQDSDADTYGNNAVSVSACTAPTGYVANNTDCNDANTNAWNTCATCIDSDGDSWRQLCNRYQTVNGPDCDDNPATGASCHNTCSNFYQDSDADTYGNAGVSLNRCTAPAGYVPDNTDCNDANTNVWSMCATCLDTDADTWYVGCNRYQTINGPDCSDTDTNVWNTCGACVDADADTWYVGCNRYLTINGPDCDDGPATGGPCHNTCAIFYQDADGDSHGNPAVSLLRCSAPAGYVADNLDCDDTDPARWDFCCGNGVCDSGENQGNCTADCFSGNLWFVDAGRPSSGAGTSWSTAFKTIPEAVGPTGAAQSGDMVWIKTGTYTNNGGGAATVLKMTAGVDVYGGFAGTESSPSQRDLVANPTTLDGQLTATHVVEAANARLDGFIVTRGIGTNGGGMAIVNCSPTVANCTFANNRAPAYAGGGGMYVSHGSPVITGCRFQANFGDRGGALYIDTGSPVITDSVFDGNSAAIGGGAIYTSYATTTIRNDKFFANTVGTDSDTGGGVYVASGSADIDNCLFKNNVARWGSAIVESWLSSARIVNCTFVANNGVFDKGIDVGDEIEIVNSVFWDSTGTIFYMGGSDCVLNISYSDVQGGQTAIYKGGGSVTNWGPGMITGNPAFVNPALNDYRLGPGSACVDSGTVTGAPAFDLAGNPRPIGPRVDMEAYEQLSPDTDGDGLTDLQETTVYFTNPNDPDTDHDGVNDGAEVHTYATDPKNWDTDGDRLPDGYEVANLAGHTLGNLDPNNALDGPADFDGDDNSNTNEYWNGSGPWAPDPTPGVYANPGCYYWGDGDGDGIPAPSDLIMLKLEIAGVPQSYRYILPHGIDTLDLDRDGYAAPADLISLKLMIAGSERPGGYPSQALSLETVSAPSGSVAAGSTTHVTLSVHSVSGVYPFAPGFGVVFEVVSGSALLLGGDGTADGLAAGNRYDFSMEAAAGARANIVLLVTGPGPITIAADVPACGTYPNGRWCDAVHSAPILINGN